jgi:3-hydroxybutyryl-CoA dehydratase
MSVTPDRRTALSSASAVLDRPFDALAVGDRFRSASRPILDEDVMAFAAVTGDWHRLHTDADYAGQTAFGARIAHGMLTLSCTIGLVPNANVLALRRIRDIVFKSPVFLGDSIYVDGRITSLAPMSAAAGMVGGVWKVYNQRDELVVRMHVETVWRRATGPGGEPGGRDAR